MSGLTPEEVARLSPSAKAVIRQQAIPQDTVSEAEFAKQLHAHGIKGYWRNWPQKSRGESWPEPIEKRRWSFDFAWIRVVPAWVGSAWQETCSRAKRGSCHGGSEVATYCLSGEDVCEPCARFMSGICLGVWIHGQVHGQRGTGKIRGDGLKAPEKGPRTRGYEAANVLHAVLYPLGWTIMTFSPQQIGSGVAVRSVKAWLAGDHEGVIRELQS